MQRAQPLSPELDPYLVLQVSRNATASQIRRAYRALLLKAHPDKNPDRPEWSEKRVRELLQAFEILGSSESRREYDVRSSKFRSQARQSTGGEPIDESRLFFFRKDDLECLALRVVYFLTHQRGREAVVLLARLERIHGNEFLRRNLDLNDYLDCLYLLGEFFFTTKRYLEAYARFVVLYKHQNAARFKRPYFELTVDSLKALYLRYLPRALSARDWIRVVEGDQYSSESLWSFAWIPRDRARLFISTAQAYQALGELGRARELASQALRVDPHSRHTQRWLEEFELT